MKIAFLVLLCLGFTGDLWRIGSDAEPKAKTLAEAKAFAVGTLVYRILLVTWLWGACL